jgi:NAD(P)-dependent dehydrogenase (short-subunit alcohol dehydrogenase family)
MEQEFVMEWSLGDGLKGRSVIVSGASGGIGADVVRALLETGTDVTAVDLDTSRMAELFPDDAPGTLSTVAVDLRDLDRHQDIIEVAQRSGPLYGLVNCAGVLRRRSDVRDVTEEDWDFQHDVNLKAAFFLCRAAAETMREAGTPGRIVTFSSQAWWTGGFGGSVAYAATKGGIVSMTRGLARTYGPAGITINSVSPGQARTEMLLTDLDERVLKSQTEATPLGRVAEPSEIAGVVLFLLSNHASFITGSTLNVSGGLLMY